jgi:choline kinase
MGDDRPKWLLEVGGTTIASRQLAALDMIGRDRLRSTTVVTGHAAEAVGAVPLKEEQALLHNPLYLTYNNWYTVLLALRVLPEEARLVVINGDLCAPPTWIARFLTACLETDEEGVLAIDFHRELTAESMKVSADETGALHSIGKHDFPEPVGEYVGMVMASGQVLKAFRAQLEAFEQNHADAQQWYEGAIGISAAHGSRWHLWATPDSGWVEIDDPADLARAEALPHA